MSVRYLQSLRSHLSRFAEHFRMNINTVTSAQIEDCCDEIKRGPRTRNNIRLSIVTLFNFAKARGYFCQKLCQPKPTTWLRRKTAAAKSGLFTPAQLADLLNAGDEEAKLYFAIGAFHRLAIGRAHSSRMGGRKFRTRIYPGWKSESKNCDASLGPDSTNLENVLAPYRAKNGLIFVSEHAADRAIAQVKAPALNGRTMF